MLGLRNSPSGVPENRPPLRPPVVERIADWSARHRFVAIAGWLVAVLLAVVAGGLVPGPGARSVDPGETGRAQQVLDAQEDAQAIQESVLVQAADPAAVRTAVAGLVAALRGAAVAEVWSPLDPGRTERLTPDRRSALVTYQIAGPVEGASVRADEVAAVVGRVADDHPGVRLALAGDRSLAAAVETAIGDDVRRSERISLPLTVAILLVVFGALVAASIPVLLTATAVVTTFGLLQVVDHWLAVNSAANTMVLLIGVAVGVDYALFSLRRVREERAAGQDTRSAVRIAARTSGRVILVSGLIVIVCLSGLLLTGIGVFRGAAIGIALVVAVAMLGSLTVLPAVLAALGHRVEWGRLPWWGRRRAAGRPSRAWGRLASAVTRRPVAWGGAAVVGLLLMAVPATGMRLQDAPVTDSLPRSVPAIDAGVRMNDAFPGAAAPARVVVWADPGVPLDARQVAEALGGIDRVTVAEYGDAVLARVPLPGSGTDPTSTRALRDLRTQVLPDALHDLDGVHWAVAGRTAFAADFADQLSRRTPLVLAFVLGLAFVLLFAVFRSIRVAAASIGLNLLSVGAAYGVLTWVFQEGNLSGPLGFTAYGGVVGWLPLFLFVLLFGLSMDYHVFILSRIRERRAADAAVGPGAHRDAIVGGIASSAGVVSSAAVIMTAAFSIFVTLSAVEYKMLGVGAAVAILLDATVVRGVLLPATLAVLGPRALGPRRAPEPPRSTLDPRSVVDESSGTRHDAVPNPANADG
ncbi:MMPL family transporter [Cryptosporangium minutisporangium]|uniref:MMPL family transporter n=1 Tax=Cryptosporangium minutisporangium TaxID=113569 RepID=A0ABP6TD97_9ACTN